MTATVATGAFDKRKDGVVNYSKERCTEDKAEVRMEELGW